MRALSESLDAIQAAQLIRRAEDLDPAYLFKHGLVQDTAYSSLMRHERRRLHRLVGEALEKFAPDRLDEFAPLLGQHFIEAGDNARALRYLRSAADSAAARYANQEALAFYTQALSVVQETDASAGASLYRARGQVYERLGAFDQARADLEQGLQLAQSQNDSRAAWQCLIDLGFAWSARDYARAGEYFERALDLARARNDPLLLAHSLNRVGNWYLNNENPERALTYHRDALRIFEAQGETRGLEETTDLLGMTYTLGGDLFQAKQNYLRSMELAQELADKTALISVLITLTLHAPSAQFYTMVPAEADLNVSIEHVRRAIPLAREIGWRSGEANGLWVLCFALQAQGQYVQALKAGQDALTISNEIEHHQWQVASLCALGSLYLEILALEKARAFLEDAHSRARATNSLHWIRTSGGFLASTCVEQGDLVRAESVLNAALPPDAPAQTVGERLCYVARIQLALARREPARALTDLQAMLAQTPNLESNTVIPQLWLLRGRAHMQQGAWSQAQTDLEAALSSAHAYRILWLEWQIHLELIRLYRALENSPQVESHAAAIRALMQSIAAQIDDTTLRENFATQLTARLEAALRA